jgi:hypothetical protein
MFSFSILPTVFATYFTLLLVLSFPFFYGSDLSFAFLTLLFPLFACVAIFALPTFLALTGAAVSTRNTYLCIVVWRRTMRKIRTIGFLDTPYGHHWQRILLTLCAYLMCLFSVSDVRYVRQHLVHVFSWRKEIVITKIKNPMDMFGLDNVHEQPKMSNYLSSTLFTKNNEINYKIIINCNK